MTYLAIPLGYSARYAGAVAMQGKHAIYVRRCPHAHRRRESARNCALKGFDGEPSRIDQAFIDTEVLESRRANHPWMALQLVAGVPIPPTWVQAAVDALI